jgi:hypothetical protein
MINITVPPANFSSGSVTRANFKMMPCAKTTWFEKIIRAGVRSAGLLALLATSTWLQAAVTPAGLPLYFEAGQAQDNAVPQFIANGIDSQFLITSDSIQFVLRKPVAAGENSSRTVSMQFLGANDKAQMAGEQELSGKINYLIGNEPARWQTGIATFARVQVAQIYPGINLTYYGNQRQLEYDFIVSPGANPGLIAIHFDGPDKISINRGGELVLNLGDGEIHQPLPLIYQMVQGQQEKIAGGYKMLDAHTVAFAIGPYDHNLPLVIDPILSYSTYFGGNASDTAWAVAVNTNDGTVYIAGQTTSTKFSPWQAPSNGYQTNFGGGVISGDAFVARFDSLGTNLIYFTYLGGNGDDVAYGLAVDAAGDAYIAGATDSANFPYTNAIVKGAYTGTNVNNVYYGTNVSGKVDQYAGTYLSDAFVAELNPSGSNLIYSTYLGGNGADAAYGVAVDSAGNAYVTGFTYSTNFPITSDAYQNHLAVSNWYFSAYYNANAFVAEIAAGGSNMLYSSYFGGTNLDKAKGIALDSSDNIYITGFTASTNFPIKKAIPQTTIITVVATNYTTTNVVNGNLLNGLTNQNYAFDAFVAKFSPGFANLIYSTFLGGANDDQANGIAVDAFGNAYVTGWTISTNYPNTVTITNFYSWVTNNLLAVYVTNAFLTQITYNGANAGIGYSTVFGGTNYAVDIGYGVAVDSAGNAFVVGATGPQGFPVSITTNTPGLLQATNAGDSDVFVTAFNTNASQLLYSVLLGGSQNDYGYGIALDPVDNAYIVGLTASSNFRTNNARQAALDGITNAFLAKIVLGQQNSSPELSIIPSGTNVVLSKGPIFPEFQLQSNTNLLSTNSWTLVHAPSNTWQSITLPMTNGDLFFRLKFY